MALYTQIQFKSSILARKLPSLRTLRSIMNYIIILIQASYPSNMALFNDAIDENILERENEFDEEEEEEETVAAPSQPEEPENYEEEDEEMEEDEDDDDEDEEMEDDEKEIKKQKEGVSESDVKAFLEEGLEQDSHKVPQEKSPEKQPPSSEQRREEIIKKAREAKTYDIVPSVGIPYSGQIHAISTLAGCRWLFTGGEDGFIRKYDMIASFEGQTPLTVAQRHSLVDTIVNAGVIVSYWENEQPVKKSELKLKKSSSQPTGGIEVYEPQTSPVYSLAVQSQALWLLSGLRSGGITLQLLRHQEGSIQAYLKLHTDCVSSLALNVEETRALSGAWDKRILDWDLNSGKVISEFSGSVGQISNLEYRPESSYEISTEDDDYDSLFGSDDDANKPETKPKKKKIKSGIDTNVFSSSTINGVINVWDKRTGKSVLEFGVPKGTPPWCMSTSWSFDGNNIYAGRRNSTVEEFDIKMPYENNSKAPKVSKTMRFPSLSGPVYTVKALPSNHHVLCGSNDNIRLYDLNLYSELSEKGKHQAIPFQIIPGHHGGVLSTMYVDPTCRFMISASGDRGWHGLSTEMILMYEINSL